MHALTFDRFGEPEVLAWREVADPVVEPGHAMVRIEAAGLNFADLYRRRGNYHMVATPPWILGYEGAGRLVTAAEGFAVGQRVAFADAPRANAELVAVPVDKLIAIPDDIPSELAASVLLQGLTAQYLVRDSHAVRAGEVVVVHAAGGGVGLLLVQLAAAAGARVIAIASSEAKRQAARAVGAADCVGDDWLAQVRALTGGGADVVYDSVGTTLVDSLAAARTGGHVVFYGFAGGDPPAVDPRVLMDRSLSLTGGDLWNVLTSAAIRRARAAELFAQIAAGTLRPTIAARVPMRDGARAHRLLEARGVIGKIVLTIDGDGAPAP